MSRRILRVIIDAQTPGARSMATWNPADKNANITLSNGNLTASSVVATGQSVRSSAAFVPGKSYYFEVTRTSGSNIYIGVGNASALLSAIPGANANSWSIGNTGAVWNNGGSSAYTTSFSTGTTIGVYLKWKKDSDTWTLHFRKDASNLDLGKLIGIAFSGLSGTLYPMIGSTSTFNATANFGATLLAYEIPDGATPGVWTQGAPTSTPLYIATESFMSQNSDDIPNTHFMGRIAESSDPFIERTASCWAWDTGSSASTKAGELIILNQDNALDSWRDLIVRDRTVTMEYGENDHVLKGGAWSPWITTVADALEFTKEGNIRITMGDALSKTDKPLTNATYPTWLQEESNREKSKPVCLGTAFIDPILVEPNLFYYDCNDEAIWSIDAVRDKGDLDTVNVDYYWRSNGIDKVHTPVGKVSALVRAGVKRGTQLLQENFTSWVAGAFDNNPASWTVSGESSSNERVYQRTTGRCAMKKSGGGSVLYMERNFGFTAGVTYIITVVSTYYSAGEVRFYTSNGAGVTSGEIFRVDGTNRTGTFTFTVTPTAGQTYLRLSIPASYTAEVEFESITANVGTHIQRLPDWVEEILVRRGGLTTSDIDSASISNLDTRAPYNLGYYARSGGKIRDLLKETADTFCGWVAPNLSGQVQMNRLQEPSSTPVLTLTKNDVKHDLVCTLDRAKNLTTSIGGMKNYARHSDSDFAGSVNPATRALLSNEYQIVKSAGGVVDNIYIHADNAPVKGILAKTADDIENEAWRMANLYRTPRYFYKITSILGINSALSLNLGDTVRLILPEFDLSSGKNLVLVGIKQWFKKQTVEFTFWG